LEVAVADGFAGDGAEWQLARADGARPIVVVEAVVLGVTGSQMLIYTRIYVA
jgi:hypothetical protein